MFASRPGSPTRPLLAGALLLALFTPAMCSALGGCGDTAEAPAKRCCATKCERATEPPAPAAPQTPVQSSSCCEPRAIPGAQVELAVPRVDSICELATVIPLPARASARGPLPFTGTDPPPLRVALYTLHASLLI